MTGQPVEATPTLRPAVATAFDDLAVFIARAKRVDPDGAARLTVTGDVLAVTVAAAPRGCGSTVLGMRVVALAEALATTRGFDVTVSLSALTDRFSRGTNQLQVPPVQVLDVPWAGMAPPRSRWRPVGALSAADLEATVRAGIDEVARTTPVDAGAAVIATIRRSVWGAPLTWVPIPAGSPPLPSAAAFGLDALGFLGDDDPELFGNGAWWRLSTVRGHVLVRSALLGG
jgi:hypothetical protein